MAKSDIETIQGILGTEPDGIWGPKSQAALNREINKTGDTGNPTLKKIQTVLGVNTDGLTGLITGVLLAKFGF
jgi:peptidoglycan hydrolase-like protein with peptidoglycan-binding domain